MFALQGSTRKHFKFAVHHFAFTGDFFPNAVLELTDGSLCFGGDNGVVVFNPMKMDKVFDKAEDIQLNKFYVDGEFVTYESGAHDNYLDAAIAYATKITLPYNQNSFSIDFSSFNYAVSSAIEYKYRLVGFEEKWHSTSTDRPHAIYNQIPPGKYKLVIRSFNEHSNKIFSEKSIAVVVQSPWYWSFWSKLLYGVVLLVMFVALYLANQIRQKRKKRLRSLIGDFLSLKQNYQHLIKKYNKEAEMPENDLNSKLKDQIMQAITDNYTNSGFGVEALSKEVGMSRVHLYRRTKELFDASPNDLIKSTRMKMAGQMLIQKSGSIMDIAYLVGFADSSYFTRSFKSYYNMTPKEFIEKFRDQMTEDTFKELFEL